MEKKGVSPVIATVLLIAIALVLAVIIFLWATNFIGEKTQKFGEPIENSCDEIRFEADASFGSDSSVINVDLVNQGDVPLYGVQIMKKEDGGIINIGSAGNTIDNGQTEQIIVPVGSSELSSGNTLIIIPVLVGESGNLKKEYVCNQKFGIERTI